MNPLTQGLLTIIIGVGGCIGYFYFSNIILDRFIFPASGPNAGRNINRANQVRPWLFLFPAIFALSLYLVYPVFATLYMSLTDRTQDYAFVGLDNYRQMASEPKFWEAMRNN
ncbi:MAG: sugar ABC transporter permease, partial [Nitratireductor sp.]|nr:sugar ABC transporter permease [Nitratireductor sp.]